MIMRRAIDPSLLALYLVQTVLTGPGKKCWTICPAILILSEN